jgi:hypothetical protein
MQKFGFKIVTKSGTTVDRLVVQAMDQPGAEAKLRQMYPQCKITGARLIDDLPRGEGTDLEGAISLIVGQDAK